MKKVCSFCGGDIDYSEGAVLTTIVQSQYSVFGTTNCGSGSFCSVECARLWLSKLQGEENDKRRGDR